MNESSKTKAVMPRLSVMMFLQFFVWGAWYVTLGTYLGEGLKFEGGQIGRAYSAMPWGAIVAPFIAGMIADRFFAAQKVMAFMHLVGGCVLYYASTVTDSMTFFWTLIVYAICYNPTLGLVNAISFRQMDNPEKQFPKIRVFGTLGWIVAGLAVGSMGLEKTNIPMKIAAAASVLLGLYSISLPDTPPKSLGHKATVKDVLGLETIKLMKNMSFFIFVLGSLLVCIPLSFYYNFANWFFNEQGMANAAGKMTMGQMSEVVFMILMPFFFARLGVKKMLLFGMLAWVGRYLLFAFGNMQSLVWMYYGGILLHGICYDFFFVTGQIYVDNTAPKTIQAQAQGFIALITYGWGMVIGSNVAGIVVDRFKTETLHDWKSIWLVPAVMSGVVLMLFALMFRGDKKNEEKPEERNGVKDDQ